MLGNIYKIRSGKLEVWKEWAKYLEENKEVTIDTIREENLIFEGSFVFTIKGEFYACLYGKPGEGGMKKASLEREINVEHRKKINECFEDKKESSIESIYFFQT